ncbi:15232_t:CDS:2 [Gigaspora margarita]|uniref:15232_t:CDS:1 n=1 Tax=Gigaspora margarita TaxID=4874 RepID=A0ABM8W6D0_GIGMA|nr:15232_t:CDS:2 [Gigaspora margarita]
MRLACSICSWIVLVVIIDEGKIKHVKNINVAEMVKAMGVVSNIINEDNDAVFNVSCNENATGSILVQSVML